MRFASAYVTDNNFIKEFQGFYKSLFSIEPSDMRALAKPTAKAVQFIQEMKTVSHTV